MITIKQIPFDHMNELILLPILIPFVTAVVCLMNRHSVAYQKTVGVIGMFLTFLASCWLVYVVDHQDMLVLMAGSWKAPFGIALVADRLSAIMVAISALMGLTVGIYSCREVAAPIFKRYYFVLYSLMIMGVNGSFLTGDLFNLYVWFEIMLLTSFVLLVIGGTKDQLDGGVKYVILNLISSAFFLASAALVYGNVGTLNMADIASKLAANPQAFLIDGMGVLLFGAFALKAALFPVFFWLPSSYHTPPVAVSAIFAGLLTKVGVYALMRTYTLVLHTSFPGMQTVILFLAGATMVTGVLGAATHFEIRRILSFHIISQIGYMVMGLAIMTPLALAGAIFYLIHHIIVKTNLFLIGGVIEKRLGTQELKKIGGLYKVAPWFAILFFIPAFSLGGIPPLSGFWAKFSVVKAGLDAGHYWLTGVALAVGIMTLYSMTKIWGEAFWKAHPKGEEAAKAQPAESLWLMILPIAVMAIMTLVIGLYGQPLFAFSKRAAEQIINPQHYIEHVFNAKPEAH